MRGTTGARAPTARLRSTRQGHRAVPTPTLGAQNISAPQSSLCPPAAPPAACLRSACAESSVGVGHGTESSRCGPWGRAPSRGRVFRVLPAVACQAFAAPLWPHLVPLCDTGGQSRGGGPRLGRQPLWPRCVNCLNIRPVGPVTGFPPRNGRHLPLNGTSVFHFPRSCQWFSSPAAPFLITPHPPQPMTTPVSLCSVNTPFLFCSLFFLWFFTIVYFF